MPQGGARAEADGTGPGRGPGGPGPARLPGAGRPPGRGAGVFAGLALALVVSLLLATGLGAVAVPPAEVVRVLLDAAARALAGDAGGEVAPAARILVDIRLPRVLLAALVGASLAAAGSAFQTLFRNPMADPYVLGVSSGGALGAALAYLVLLGLSTGAAGAAEGPPGGAAGPAAGGLGGVAGALVRIIGFGLVPAGAFVGALGAVVAVSRLARVGGRLAVGTLLLAGVAVASLLGALVSLLVFLSGERLRPIVFWLLGSLSGAGWRDVEALAVAAALGLGILASQVRALNALWLGEEPAHHLGVDVEAVKRRLLVAGSLLAATAVSVSGVIGFVGLIVPHAVRLMVGADHRRLLPGAVLAGATVMILCDTVARLALAPAELPVGVVTALAGAPWFLWLLRRHAAGRDVGLG
ncbi:FecCD family ABC transporter permease [Thermaerobacter composti]|uniref:Iron chelate uptake ABC transporter family permease subunit n=1 Tax=Thermaerobacter composti TaxID=554949 RepID=A0ABZ0QNJ2_9FIRM|nr:iron chelate uptake ABC transporter family permease subunit [Thermaerobacter composti]WPD18082.1 iron chelate uptake ABC transporter family permease subunit [Thermaerobacter composti]